MKFAVVLFAVLAVALAAPAEKDAQIVSQSADISPDGSFKAGFETSNGIKSSDSGTLRVGRDEKNNELQYLVRSGEFSWQDLEGQLHTIRWTADENGFQAEGNDVPKTA